MIIGQSAGVAAALAADQDVVVQELNHPQLRKRLRAQNQVLELPDVSELPRLDGSIDPKTLPGTVLDDSVAELSGTWANSTNFKPFISSSYVVSGENDSQVKDDGKSAATFRVNIPETGQYQLLMAYSAHETRAPNVPVTVISGDHEAAFIVDQTQPLPSGQHFTLVGDVSLESGVETTIVISNEQAVGFVIVDALHLLLCKR